MYKHTTLAVVVQRTAEDTDTACVKFCMKPSVAVLVPSSVARNALPVP